jgi:hypothetical protein
MNKLKVSGSRETSTNNFYISLISMAFSTVN